MPKRTPRPPHLAEKLLGLCLRDEDRTHRIGDFEEVFQSILSVHGRGEALNWYWRQVLRSLPELIKNSILWRGVMFQNYIKIAFRNTKKHKGYSGINILGLAVSIASALLIFMYVHQEFNYDTYHKDANRIYRVFEEYRQQGETSIFAPIPWPLAPTLKERYPQVESAVRLDIYSSARLIKHNNRTFYEDLFVVADPEIFEVLTFTFLQGDPISALERPNTLVITERTAKKYFGRDFALGKTIEADGVEYMVTGVVKDAPANTHLKYDFIASLKTFAGEERFSNWYGNSCYTYIKLRKHVDVESFASQIRLIAHDYVDASIKQRGTLYIFHLQPLEDIHLHSRFLYEIEPPGNSLTLSLFAGIGILVLLIAIMNFINLSTARSMQRAKEVGLRKVVGGIRKQLMIQFFGETLFITLCAVCLGLILVLVFLPQFNNLAGSSFTLLSLQKWTVIAILTGILCVVGLGSGIYPSIYLSAFPPAAIFRRSASGRKKHTSLRKILVVFQFAISILLIVGTLVIHQQIDFLKRQDLGFDKNQKYVIPVRGGASIRENYETVKSEFCTHSSILGATASSCVPGRPTSSFGIRLLGEDDSKTFSMYHMYFDPDFIPDYGIEMVAGRPHRSDMKTDVSNWERVGGYLINEASVKALGWSTPEQAIGRRLITGLGGREGTIIGVTRDFHFRGLQTSVEPLIMEWFPQMLRAITLIVNPTDLERALEFAEGKWSEFYPGVPFEGFFLDRDFELQYRSEERMSRIVGTFTFMGIFIACLGLIGLASFTAEQRTKEIGIRKVLGASIPGIVIMLSKEFVKWVLLANLIAWPVAYSISKSWLKNFAYHADLNILTFLLASVLAFVLALLTVTYQSIKVAMADPVVSLRHE